MDQLDKLNNRIISRVNVNLAEFDFDVGPFVTKALNNPRL